MFFYLSSVPDSLQTLGSAVVVHGRNMMLIFSLVHRVPLENTFGFPALSFAQKQI
jgi:hypothetical protein